MLKIDLKGVVATDTGYGLEVEGVGTLEDIISRALKTKDKNGGTSYKNSYLKDFKSNNCDISVTIVTHQQEAIIENDEYDPTNINEFLDELEAGYGQYKKKDETPADEE